MSKIVKENFIITLVEQEKVKGFMKRKNSLFSNELDDEWEDFLMRRVA
jgi:hypothetical protein